MLLSRTPMVFLSLIITPFLSAQNAKDIVRRADEKSRGNSSTAEITIEIVRPSWQRDMTLKTWTKDTRYSMILITDPARDKGTVFLKRKKEVWNWVPTIERTIKLPPSMMNQSWMGTDFTNDDLVKEASILEDYTHTLLGSEAIRGFNCHKIELRPLPQSAVVWGKIVIWIDKRDDIVIRSEYFDEDDALINTLDGYDVKSFDGRTLCSRVEMIPADKPDHKTVMRYHSVTFNRPIDDSFFTTQSMQRVR